MQRTVLRWLVVYRPVLERLVRIEQIENDLHDDPQ